MKRRTVGRDFTSRIERYLERPDDGSLMALFCEHWSRKTDPAGIAREAAAWLRSRGFPDRPTAGSLCERLRSDGARHDSPEDLAARIIDLMVCLEAIESRGKDWFNAEVPAEVGVHPSLERLRPKYWFTAGVAVELGKLHALFSIYRQLDDPRKKHRKRKHDVWGELRKSLGDVSSPEEAWSAIPEDEEGEYRIEAGGVPWRIYRDGDRLYAVNNRTGAQKSIKRETFFKYLTRKVSD